MAPVRTTGIRPRRPGRTKGCLIAIAVLFFGPKLLTGCLSNLGSVFDSNTPSPTATPSSSACPARIARMLPGGEAALVRAYRTKNKHITLCRTPNDHLYYYGEFTGRPSTGLVMKAEETSDGYVARNGPYRYTIEDGKVTVTRNGGTIGREGLTPEPSPS